MGRDNHPKERQARQLERKLNRRASYDRILIVCEGSKTEPNYFEEIRISVRRRERVFCLEPESGRHASRVGKARVHEPTWGML